jgi:uncharacterized protein
LRDDTQQPHSRIVLIDALRGSALMGILLLHATTHWSFPRFPEVSSTWLGVLDARTRDLGLFLIEGKAHAIFAMMFGVSFFMLQERWTRRGIRFRGRYLWRLVVLAVLGYIDGIIYYGDVLLTIAILGMPLVFIHRLGNRSLAWIAFVLLLQVPALWGTGQALFVKGYQPSSRQPWVSELRLQNEYAEGSFLAVSAVNAGCGQLARLGWAIESGRYLQMMGLFVCGLLVGRSRILEDPARSVRLGRQALFWGLAGFAVMHFAKHRLGGWGLQGAGPGQLGNLLSAYRNLAQIAVWVGAFILLHQCTRARAALDLLAPYGRMSLTGYVTQGLIGVPLFYGYGLALYRHLGPFESLMLGGGILVVQCAGAHYWLQRFRYGPLEWLWRSCTFLDFSTPMRKDERQRMLSSER